MPEPIELKGITWDHSRALPPLIATAQRFEELNPGTRIRWEKRSLHEFGHMPIDQLADRFDLIVIDHPWAGFCFGKNLVLDLGERIEPSLLIEMESRFVGPSWASYRYEGQHLAIPIDCATPVPSWRPDLLRKANRQPPQTFFEAVSLADAGLAAMPAFPADLFLNWSMLLEALQAEPYSRADQIAETEPAKEAMERLKRMAEGMNPFIYEANPIRLAETMTRTEEVAYNPFAYSYNNYSRPSFTEAPLRFGNLPLLEGNVPLKSVLGGTGLAITRSCRHIQEALEFSLFCARPDIQAGIYSLAGGQPAECSAWEDETLNTLSYCFFELTREAHEQAIVRPRYDGYVSLQEDAGIPLQHFLKGDWAFDRTWDAINAAYRDSLPTPGIPPSL